MDLANPFTQPLRSSIADWPRHPSRVLYGESGDLISLLGFDFNHGSYGTAQFSVVPDPVATPEPASAAICGGGLLIVSVLFSKRRNSIKSGK
jgi:hypothetical protein